MSSEGGKISLSFSLTHRMALAVIRIPESVTKYYVDSQGFPSVKTIHTTPGSVTFEGSVKPFAGKAGDVVDDFTYRYLVRPRRSASVTGSFALDEDEGEGVESRRRFTVSIPADLTSGTYRVFSLYGGLNPRHIPTPRSRTGPARCYRHNNCGTSAAGCALKTHEIFANGGFFCLLCNEYGKIYS